MTMLSELLIHVDFATCYYNRINFAI